MKKLWPICFLIIAAIISFIITVNISDIEKPLTEAKKEVAFVEIEEEFTQESPKVLQEVKSYTDEELMLLAQLIQAEVGSDNCSDYLQQCVGSVVINRKNDKRYPDTIKEVIYDKKYGIQYDTAYNGMIPNIPSERALENAKIVLDAGGILPREVIFQSEKKQGNIFAKILNQYFCIG